MLKSTILLLSVSFVFSNVRAQTEQRSVDEIIGKYLTTIGGEQAVKALAGLRLSGNYTSRGVEYPFTLTRLKPNLCRLELTIQGNQHVVAFDGEVIWEMNESRGIGPRPVRDLRTRTFILAMADLDGALVDSEAKGHAVALVGEEEVDGKPASKLKVTLKSGSVEEWFIDASSFLLMKTERRVAQDNDELVQALYFMDYESVDGLMIPRYIERLDDHRVAGYEITEIEKNPKIDPQSFKMPN